MDHLLKFLHGRFFALFGTNIDIGEGEVIDLGFKQQAQGQLR
jgi:hypothetical protein